MDVEVMSQTEQIEPLEQVCRMVRLDPKGEVFLLRNGKNCLGYLAPNGYLYYAAIKEVDLDVECSGEQTGTTSPAQER
jgi:hypothetical protein